MNKTVRDFFTPLPFAKRLLGCWFLWCALYKGFSAWFVLPLWLFLAGTALTCAAAYALQKKAGLSFMDDTVLCAGAMVFAVVLTYRYGGNHPYLFTSAVLLALGIALFPVLRRRTPLAEGFSLTRRGAAVWCAVLAVLMFGVIAVITCLRYTNFMAPNFDFGLFCHMFHNMKETLLPLVTSERNQLLSHFAVHISPIYYLLLPFYALFPSPLTLQIGQAAIVASGLILLWGLTRHFRLSATAASAVLFVYAAHPALTAGCFYDLHENCFLAPLLLWLFWCYETGRFRLMLLPILLIWLTKEDAPVYTAMFGIYLMFSRREWRRGMGMFVASAAYFAAAVLLLQAFGTGAMFGRYDGLLSQASACGSMVHLLLRDPGFFLEQMVHAADKTAKPLFLLQLLLPFGLLLWKTRVHSRLLLLAPLLLHLLTDYPYQYNIGFQYTFGTTAFLFYLWVQNAAELPQGHRRNPLLFGAAAACLLYITAVIPRLESYTVNAVKNHEMYTSMASMLDTVPDTASVTASSMLVAHLAQRDVIYEDTYRKTPDTDYVVLDMRMPFRTASEAYEALCAEHGYITVDYSDEIVILKKDTSA